MTVRELIDKLSTMSPELPVLIATTVTRQGSELTGCWDEDAWKDLKSVDDLQTRVVLTME